MSALEKQVTPPTPEIVESVIIKGDLSGLTATQKATYYKAVADSLGLNYLTKPFDYINLDGGLKLYVNRSATDQLRQNHKVSIKIVEREIVGDLYIVTAQAWLPDGRQDESTGVVDIKGKNGAFLANLYMKAESKAKRRVTLSIIGLGWLSEEEAMDIPGAQIVEEGSGQRQGIKQIKTTPDFACSPDLAVTLQSVCADAVSVGIKKDELTELLSEYGAKGITELGDGAARKFCDALMTKIGEAREAKRSEEEV